ncbi:MAG: class I SAM-dependent methyltransferase [Thermodesulfobacteriota bacterium]
MNWRTFTKVPSSLKLAHHFLPSIRPGHRILDVGCGEAAVGEIVTLRMARYFGVDVNLPSLKRVAGRYTVAAGEGARLPFRDATFDLVMLRAVLTVLPDRLDLLAVLREALRVCRGKVGVQDFLTTPQIPLYGSRYRQGVALGKPYGVFPVLEDGAVLYWARHFDPEELRAMVQEAGGRVTTLAEAPAPTRSGNVIRGVTLLACPEKDFERAGT